MGGHPLEFPPAPNVPIVGMPCEVHDIQPDILVTCKCDGPIKDRLIRLRRWADVGLCRACRRGVKIKRFAFDAMTGQVQLEVDQMIEMPALGEAGKPS
jgi:hypothetical protein